MMEAFLSRLISRIKPPSFAHAFDTEQLLNLLNGCSMKSIGRALLLSVGFFLVACQGAGRCAETVLASHNEDARRRLTLPAFLTLSGEQILGSIRIFDFHCFFEQIVDVLSVLL